MKRHIPGLTAVVVLVGILPALCAPTGTGAAGTMAAGAKVRIGTYRSRVVALCYWRSAAGMKRIEGVVSEAMAAKKAGDAHAAELVKKAQDLQRQLHNEVFGNLPIPEVVEAMKVELGEVAAEERVVAIVPEVGFAAEGVEVVDVTGAIVEKCGPTEQTRRVVAEMEKHPPAEMRVVGED